MSEKKRKIDFVSRTNQLVDLLATIFPRVLADLIYNYAPCRFPSRVEFFARKADLKADKLHLFISAQPEYKVYLLNIKLKSVVTFVPSKSGIMQTVIQSCKNMSENDEVFTCEFPKAHNKSTVFLERYSKNGGGVVNTKRNSIDLYRPDAYSMASTPHHGMLVVDSKYVIDIFSPTRNFWIYPPNRNGHLLCAMDNQVDQIQLAMLDQSCWLFVAVFAMSLVTGSKVKWTSFAPSVTGFFNIDPTAKMATSIQHNIVCVYDAKQSTLFQIPLEYNTVVNPDEEFELDLFGDAAATQPMRTELQEKIQQFDPTAGSGLKEDVQRVSRKRKKTEIQKQPPKRKLGFVLDVDGCITKTQFQERVPLYHWPQIPWHMQNGRYKLEPARLLESVFVFLHDELSKKRAQSLKRMELKLCAYANRIHQKLCQARRLPVSQHVKLYEGVDLVEEVEESCLRCETGSRSYFRCQECLLATRFYVSSDWTPRWTIRCASCYTSTMCNNSLSMALQRLCADRLLEHHTQRVTSFLSIVYTPSRSEDRKEDRTDWVCSRCGPTDVRLGVVKRGKQPEMAVVQCTLCQRAAKYRGTIRVPVVFNVSIQSEGKNLFRVVSDYTQPTKRTCLNCQSESGIRIALVLPPKKTYIQCIQCKVSYMSETFYLPICNEVFCDECYPEVSEMEEDEVRIEDVRSMCSICFEDI